MEEKIREIEKRLIALTGSINYLCHLVEEIYMFMEEGKRKSVNAENTSQRMKETILENPIFKNNPAVKEMVNGLFSNFSGVKKDDN